jgi:hypothetical protein
MVSRRALIWLCFAYFIAGLVWGGLGGHYVGFAAGELDANKKWLKAIELYMEEPLPPCNCDSMPSIQQPKERWVGYERVQEVS